MIDHLKQDRWYVDVRGNVRGPLTSYDIIQELIAGTLKVIHRVSQNNDNWKAICNTQYFENAVDLCIEYYMVQATNQEAKGQEADIDESSGFHNLSQISKGISAQLNEAQNLQEINVGLNSLRKLKAEMLHNKKQVITAAREVRDEVHQDDKHVYVDMHTEDKVSVFARNKLLTSVVIICAILLGGLKFLEYQDHRAAELLDEQVKLLQKEKALLGYEEALGADGMSSGQLIQLAEDEIAKENFTLGEQLLQKAIDVAEVGFDKSKAHSLLGFIATQSDNLELAAQSYETSMKSSQKVYLAFHNYGILKLKMKQPARAEELFLKALNLKEGPADRSPTIFGLFESAIQLDQIDNAKAKAIDGEKFVPSHLRTQKAAGFLGRVTSQYEQERLLAELFLDHSIGSKRLDRRKLLAFLKSGEAETQDKPKNNDAGLDVSRVAWNHLYSWCLPIYNRDRKSVHLNALFGYCVLKGRGPAAAKPYIDFAAQKAPHDPMYKAFQKLVENQLKADKTATVAAPQGG